MRLTQEEEAQYIFQILHDQNLGLIVVPGDRVYPGLAIDGKVAILEMKEAKYPRWKEMEWPAYYISFILEEKLTGRMDIKREGKRVCFKGDYLWDARLKSSESNSSWVPLTDVRNIDKNFADETGFGLIIIIVLYKYDEDGSFREWHEKEKGGSSEYTKKIELEGRKPRRRKTYAFLIEGNAYYFPSYEDFRSGVQQGWLDEDFARTMRNSNENSRNPKYAIDWVNIPRRFKLLRHNFNIDVEEFEEEIFLDA